MSNGKHSSDEGLELGNIPWKAIGISVLVIIILVGVFFCGRTAYSALIANGKLFKKEKENADIIEEEKMPTQISGNKVLGELKFETLNYSQYILEAVENNKDSVENSNNLESEIANQDVTNTSDSNTQTNNSLEISDALKNGIVKLYGNEINQKGNFCIIGHNKEEYFSVLNEVNVDDKFSIKSSSNIEKKYIVTDIYTIEPTDLKCLMPNDDYIEVTLITCTAGSNQRLVIKAIEENDYEKYKLEKENNVTNNADELNSTIE